MSRKTNLEAVNGVLASVAGARRAQKSSPGFVWWWEDVSSRLCCPYPAQPWTAASAGGCGSSSLGDEHLQRGCQHGGRARPRCSAVVLLLAPLAPSAIDPARLHCPVRAGDLPPCQATALPISAVRQLWVPCRGRPAGTGPAGRAWRAVRARPSGSSGEARRWGRGKVGSRQPELVSVDRRRAREPRRVMQIK